MQPIDCPFFGLDAALAQIGDDCPTIVLDMHAEATSREAGNGLVCRRPGKCCVRHPHPHSHGGRRLLSFGTAYCTDVGMTGPYDSVIGTRTDLVLHRFTTGRPTRFHVAESNPRVAGALIRVNPKTGRATAIETFFDPPGPLDDPTAADEAQLS